MIEAGDRSYSNVLSYVSRTPWAITGEGLGLVQEVIHARLSGWRPTAEEVVDLERMAATRPGPARVGAVAVIPLQGLLVPRASMFSAMSGGTSMDAFGQAVTAAANDPAVAQIIIDVDSPGGVSDMIPETAALIRAARDVKPVTAVANVQAGSAAYWLASQATDVSVTPSGYVGSIGVFGIHTDVSQARAALGIRDTIIKSTASPFKAEMLPIVPLSAEAQAAAQREVDQTCEVFIAEVATGRGVDPDHVAAQFGQGRMVSASQAVTVGMADRVETLTAAINRVLGRTAAGGGRLALTPGQDAEPSAERPSIVAGAEALLARPGFRAALSTQPGAGPKGDITA